MFKHHVPPGDKIFYTTGRLTSEMVIKTVRMGTRSWCRALVHRLGRGAGAQGEPDSDRRRAASASSRSRAKSRIVFDQDLAYVEEEAPSTGARRRCR